MPQNVARHSLNVFQDYVAEYGFPDVMSTALVLVLLMERTVKERALRSVIVRRPLIQLLTAVGTVHQPGKDAASACTGIAMPLLAHLLYLLKRIFDLCMKGRGPMQIANQLKADKVLTPSAYRALQASRPQTRNRRTPATGTAVPLWRFWNGGSTRAVR